MDATTLRQACTATEQIVDQIGDEHFGLPTPCDAWTVRDLLNHVLGTLALGQALLSDAAPTMAIEPGGLPLVDLVGDDHLKAYRVGVERLLAAADSDAFERTHTTPLGDMPGTLLAGFTTLDIVVHGWDLAVATGVRPVVDDQLAETVLTFAHQTITAETRAPRIGPEVFVPADAPATDRLVAYLGRRP